MLLSELGPKDIQDYYSYCLNTEGLSPNTVIHIHANIRKALQYALKTGLINFNPADRVERPKKNDYTADIYDRYELAKLFEAAKGTKLELAVILGAFYGLRRSEIVGLRWDAIDFERNLLTIKYTVTEAVVDGKYEVVEKAEDKDKIQRKDAPTGLAVCIPAAGDAKRAGRKTGVPAAKHTAPSISTSCMSTSLENA